ncbi:MAG: glycosyltransferase [Erythrobacter sp.]|jgi:glycosyltransferase involved in cell wall biosynthesis|nr:glycosyltransferase [Erythrobacter sp.]
MRSDSPLVVHVSADFPDAVDPDKTGVIRSLLDLTRDRFDHRVFSLNRRSPNLGTAFERLVGRKSGGIDASDFEYGHVVRYRAPSRGILHRTMLLDLGDWLASEIARWPARPALLVAHKVTIEGIAVQRAADCLGVPFAVSIQGDTDTKVIAARPDLARVFRRIVEDARVVFPFAPWAWDAVRRRLGAENAQVVMLPCPTDIDVPLAPMKGGNGPLTAFHLRNHRRKNLSGIAKAMTALEREGMMQPLTVLGSGDEATVAACQRVIGEAPVVLAGAADRETMRRKMNVASVFVLPSRRESFGLVFIEALIAGLPVIYPSGAAVDGYFDDMPFAIAVDARNPRAIASAIAAALRDEAELKAALAEWQISAHAATFRRPAIAEAFARGLELAIEGRRSA